MDHHTGPAWAIQQKKGRKLFSLGVWAPADRITAIRAELEAESSTDREEPLRRRLAAIQLFGRWRDLAVLSAYARLGIGSR